MSPRGTESLQTLSPGGKWIRTIRPARRSQQNCDPDSRRQFGRTCGLVCEIAVPAREAKSLTSALPGQPVGLLIAVTAGPLPHCDLRGRAIVALIWFRLASRTEEKYKQSRTAGDGPPWHDPCARSAE